MTDYYVDLDNPAAWSTRDGTDHTGNEWLGLSGLQKAADTITAGNTINIKGTVVCTNLLNVSHDAWSATALTLGEACSWDSGGTGVVSEPNTSDVSGIVIEKLTGNNPIDNETITGGTSGQTVTVDASASSVKSTGLDMDTNAGTIADGFIKFIGVNSSWVNDGTRAKLDGNAGPVPGCLDVVNPDLSFLYLENIEVDDADDDGFDATNNDQIFINCWAHHCDDDGFKTAGQRTTFIRCLSSNNSGKGFETANDATHIGCISHLNQAGFNPIAAKNIYLCCIAAENTTYGFNLYGRHGMYFSVADENADGVSVTYNQTSLILFNRITNQTDDGIVATSGHVCYEDWNLFYGNTGDDRDDTTGAGLIEQGGNSKTDSAGDGYTDQAGHDFNLTDSADYRREAITLPKWDGTSP